MKATLNHPSQARETSCTAGTNRIKKLSVTGGFQDGLQLELSDGLNCIIGGRGTGKTSLLQLIRFALDQLPVDQQRRKEFDSLLRQNLDGGTVSLEIVTHAGLEYRITRSWDEPPTVWTMDGKPTQLTLQAGNLFQADIFSQNQIESIARDRPSQLRLLDSFEMQKIHQIETEIQKTAAALRSNADQIGPMRQRISELKHSIATLPDVEAKLKSLAKCDENVSDEVNLAHQHKAQRDREGKVVENAGGVLNELMQWLDAGDGRCTGQIEGLADKEILEGPNGQQVRAILTATWECGQQINQMIQDARRQIVTTQEEMDRQGAVLTTTHQQQESDFRRVIQRHRQAQGQVNQRTDLERRRNALMGQGRELEKLTQSLAESESQRIKLRDRLLRLRRDRYNVRQSVTIRINSELEPGIRVQLAEEGETSQYAVLLQRWLKNAKLQHGIVAGKIVAGMNPCVLAEAVRDRDTALLADKAELNESQAQKVVESLSNDAFLFELEMTEMPDRPTIELLDRGRYKQSLKLSTGQKCTSILPILLLKNETPLLVDQPEDNLDNAFIYSTIVDSIRRIKQDRQLIFVTHNPNIPVLGEAGRVFVLESTDDGSRLAQAGSIDDCKQRIVNLLEGGQEAFEQRSMRYSDTP